MGLLDARIDAEKIGFPVVGETEKDASNVIDYNIREEQTIDNFSVINANNQTTTGMATVIPGLNTNKLLAKTSIIGNFGQEPGSAGATLSSSVGFHSDSGGTYYFSVKTFNISSETGDLQYTQGDNGIIIPKNATYYLKVSYPEGSSSAKFDTSIMLDNTVLHTHNGSYNNTTYSDEFFVYLEKGKSLWADFVGTATHNITISRTISIEITSIT